MRRYLEFITKKLLFHCWKPLPRGKIAAGGQEDGRCALAFMCVLARRLRCGRRSGFLPRAQADLDTTLSNAYRCHYIVTMGVPETLQRLGPLMKEANLWEVARGRTLGFDGHVFLHHFVYACAADILLHDDYKPLSKMFRQRCQQIVGQGITPIVVFDGGRLPAKHSTDQARAEARARAYARHQLNADPAAQALVAAGRLGDRAVRAVIEELCEHGIKYIVAPYEADAQLAYMSNKGIIWGAVTVDSDFVMHGVKRIFYKVDYHFGNCYMVDMAIVLDSNEWPNLPIWQTPFLDLLGRHGSAFLLAYALCAGCDYNTKVKNI